jgi:hypothetical protein
MEDRPTAEQVVALLSTYTNFKGSKEEVAVALDQEHRTLQQGIFGIFLMWVELLAEHYEAGSYDARNEASCEAAAKMMWAFDGELPVLPFI